MAKSLNLTNDWGPTQFQFLNSRAWVLALIGPQGEGKTHVGAWRMYEHSREHWERTNGQKAVWVVIRDTWENLNRWTVPSILKALPFLVQPSNAGKEIIGRYMHVYLLGMQDFTSLAKLQGAQPAGVWLEEPAPYVDRGNAGLSQEVFDVALSRVGRQEGSVASLQITMNPADEEHWTTTELITYPRFPSKKFPSWTLEVYQIPYGENTYLTQEQREGVYAAFARNEGFQQRFIEGKPAFVQIGEPVTPEYNPLVHKANIILEPMIGLASYRFWDGGLNPTCVLGQVTPGGTFMVLDSWVGNNIGMKQLIENYIQPALNSDRYEGIGNWHDIGDPSLEARDPVNSNIAVSRVIEDMLHTSFRPGPIDWPSRREAVKTALNKLVGGQPFIYISAHEKYLSKALRGGWHYAKNNSGQVLRDGAVKDEHSHPGDAFGYGMCEVLNLRTVKPQKVRDAYSPLPKPRGSWMAQ